jgi:hypothetical protein
MGDFISRPQAAHAQSGYMPILGENSKLEFRVDAYNLFNNLNFNPTSISNAIGTFDDPNSNPNFGVATSALGARTVTLSARFSF